jgi:predicted  nucleic acid-binding Zn-ribbon protein
MPRLQGKFMSDLEDAKKRKMSLERSLKQVQASNDKRAKEAEKAEKAIYEKEFNLKIQANEINKSIRNIAFVALLLSALSFVISMLAYFKN